MLILTLEDPKGGVGSGGAMLNALLVVTEHLSAKAGFGVGNNYDCITDYFYLRPVFYWNIFFVLCPHLDATICNCQSQRGMVLAVL